MTVKFTPLLAVPAAGVTITLPLPAPPGTVATTLEADQLEIAAACPAKVTVPVALPKPPPAMVTEAPAGPLDGVNALMTGITVKATPLLRRPPLVTTTLPVVALLGTTVAMLESDQVVVVADWPLNVTVPAVPPK